MDSFYEHPRTAPIPTSTEKVCIHKKIIYVYTYFSFKIVDVCTVRG